MDNRTGMLLFFSLVIVFLFSLIFGVVALSEELLAAGIVALAGFILSLGFSIFQAALMKREGGSMTNWFNVYTIVVGIVFVWFLTRSGTVIGLW